MSVVSYFCADRESDGTLRCGVLEADSVLRQAGAIDRRLACNLIRTIIARCWEKKQEPRWSSVTAF